MPFLAPIIAGIGSAFAAVGSFIGGTLGGLGFFGKALLSIGLNLATAALQKAFGPKQKAPPSGVELELQLGENVARKVVCGRAGIAGHFNYASAYGTANGTLQQCFVLSDFFTTALDKIWIDGEVATLGAEDATKGFVVTSGDYAGKIWFKFHDGRQTSADVGLVAGANPSGRWTAEHVGYGTSYVVATLQYDREKLTQPPQFLFELRGAPLYDPRKDSTVGGSGLHRWADQSTWEYSANPALIDYNYRRGFSINGDLFCGMGMPASDLPIDKYVMAANICDEDVSGRARYICSIGLDCTQEHGDNIKAIMMACGGIVVNAVDGSFPIIGTAQATVATLTEADLVVGQPVNFQRRRPMDDLVNSVQGTYPNPDNQWSAAGYQRATDASLVALDRRTRDVAMDFGTVPDGEQASQLAAIYLSENRFEATASIVVRARWQVLEVGDWISLQLRYGTFTMMVTDTELFSLDKDNPRCVALTLQQRDGDIYGNVGVTLPTTPLPPAQPVFQEELVDFAVVAVLGSGADGIVYPALRASWAAQTDPTVARIALRWRVKADPDVLHDRTLEAGQTVAFLASGVVSSTVFEVSHKIIADPARATSWSAWVEVTSLSTPSNDVSVSLSQVQLDISGRFKHLQREIDVLIKRTAEITTAHMTSDLSNYKKISETVEELGQSRAVIREEQLVRATEDEALASRIETVSSAVSQNSASIITEQTTRAAADSAMATVLGLVQVDVGANTSAIATEATTRASADSSLASQIATLNSTVGDNTAAIATEATTRASADGSLAAQIATLNSAVGDNTAAIATEATTRASADTSLAAQLATLNSTVGTNAAAITTEATTRASADNALAASVTEVQARADDATAGGLFKIEAEAGAGSILARIVMYVRADLGDAFEEAGSIYEVYDDGGTIKSRILMNADQFVITDGSNESLPLVFEGGELKLQVAHIGSAILDSLLQTSTGKLKIGDFGGGSEGLEVYT